jgi:hypothetical protein
LVEGGTGPGDVPLGILDQVPIFMFGLGQDIIHRDVSPRSMELDVSLEGFQVSEILRDGTCLENVHDNGVWVGGHLADPS